MFRILLKSTLQRATVTQCDLHSEDACVIDEDLLDAANICENEQIHVWNVHSGEQFILHAIQGERGSGMISINGSAARRARAGDLVTIASFAQVHDDQARQHEPRQVFVNGRNQPVARRI